jgi:hypothetical protein
MWYWQTRVHNAVQGGHFGAATRAINGGECNGAAPVARKRWGLLLRCLAAVRMRLKIIFILFLSHSLILSVSFNYSNRLERTQKRWESVKLVVIELFA